MTWCVRSVRVGFRCAMVSRRSSVSGVPLRGIRAGCFCGRTLRRWVVTWMSEDEWSVAIATGALLAVLIIGAALWAF